MKVIESILQILVVFWLGNSAISRPLIFLAPQKNKLFLKTTLATFELCGLEKGHLAAV
jgi:hypothetical protein